MSNDYGTIKPLPGELRDDLPAPPFDDAPLVSQEAPETPRFIEAYEHVGRPRILVWVSHSAGGFYDEAAAKGIDYAAMQNILIDWLSAGGKVAIIAPEAARQSLTPQQVQDLNGGAHPANSQDITDRLRVDVLVLLQAQPTRQSTIGPEIRLVADASNLRGGESIGRAVVDVPPPLEKTQINRYTRFVARKLMADMTGAWNTFGGPEAEAPPAGVPPAPGGAAPQSPPPQSQPAVPTTQPAAAPHGLDF